MRIIQIVLASSIAIGFAFLATAGSIDDTDGDLIPDVFDNCSLVANGPAGQDQLDADGDGFGNICDADLTNDGVIAGTDFSVWAANFGMSDTVADITGDGVVAGTDFVAWAAAFGGTPGPGATAI